MSDTTPLISEGNRNVENPLDEVAINAARAQMVHRKLNSTVLVISVVGFILFFASYIIAMEAPFTPWWDWDAGRINVPLSIIMLLSVIFCILRFAFRVPELLAWMIQTVLVGLIIPALNLAFHDSRFPSSKWCRITGGPIGGGETGTIYPPRHCKDWKLALSIVMGTAIGCAIIVCAIYICELLVGVKRLVFGRAWKGRNLMTFDIPSGTFKFEVNIGFIRQEHVQRGVAEGEESASAHGPVYI